MRGRRSRDMGARVERGIVTVLQVTALAAVRVPLSGVVCSRFGGVMMPLTGRDLCLEVKVRADGFRMLNHWLRDRDGLIVKADRQETLVVVRPTMAAFVAKI